MVDGLFTQPEIYRGTQDTALRPLAARPALPRCPPGATLPAEAEPGPTPPRQSLSE